MAVFVVALIGTSLSVPRPDFMAGGDHHEHHEHHDHHHEHQEHHGDHAELDTNEIPENQPPPSSAKKCTLERATSNLSNECFKEPECQNVCTETTNKVR